jgi:hypothetical protein
MAGACESSPVVHHEPNVGSEVCLESPAGSIPKMLIRALRTSPVGTQAFESYSEVRSVEVAQRGKKHYYDSNAKHGRQKYDKENSASGI